MSDPRTELAELVAEARAILLAAVATGCVDDADGLSRDGAHRSAAVGVAPEVASESLAAIRADLGDCQRCGLCGSRRNVVFGRGDARAELMVIGAAPGEREDVAGEPFVGAAGQVLDKMLVNVLGLSRGQVYLSGVVKCRPPVDRDPLPSEIAQCLPFLERQIQAIQPRAILVLGSVAYRGLFGASAAIAEVRGRWHALGGTPVMPTFHPAHLIEHPGDKRATFQDLKALRARLDALRSGEGSGALAE